MKKWISILFLLPALLGHSKTKIYDCFLFFNELDILEIRLAEMYDHVDHFVLVESVETFQGNLKPLFYQENKKRYAKYNDKITHIIVKDRIPGVDKHWDREYFQRDQILRGLVKCSMDDIVILSDVDEIIRGPDVKRFISPVKKRESIAVTAHQRFYRFYVNRREVQPFWTGSVATTYEFIRQKKPKFLRDHRHIWSPSYDVGWHFTDLGGLESYLYKLNSWAHPEKNTTEARDPNFIYNHIHRNFILEAIDGSFPLIIQKNIRGYIEKGVIDYEENYSYH